MYTRHLLPLIRELLADFRIVYLTGPRQAGKTTLARSVAGEVGMRYITLDDPAVLDSIRSDPHGFVRSLDAARVVLDEFQYAPELIPAIKEASDRLMPQEKGKFLLTGSADIFRSAKAQEALPGHMARLELYPLSISEIASQRLNLVDFLIRGDFHTSPAPFPSRDEIAGKILEGGYPEVQKRSSRARTIWFRSYVEGRLFKDFETLYAARGDYHSKLRALTPYLAGLSANLLKYSNIANDLEIDDRLTKSYVEILELLFIVKRLPGYLKNRAKRAATRMPKLHYIDTGLACHLLGLRSEHQLLQSGYYGALFENLLCMEVFKHATWAAEQAEIYHFRDRRKREVDIVLEHSGSRVIGIEVKASASVSANDFKNLANLAEFAGSDFDRGILFYTGERVLPFRFARRTFHALPVGLLEDAPISRRAARILH